MLTLQWAPSDSVTATLDYAYMENKVQQQRSELSVWFSQTAGDSSWTDGPVAAPIIYEEEYNGADLSMGGMQLATKNSGDSLGFNVEWEVNDSLSLELDYHNSSAESRPDSNLGSAGVLGVAAYVRGNTTVDYSGEIPIVNVVLPPGMTAVQAADALVTGSVFQNSYNKSEVEQLQADGRFRFGDYSGLDFGIAATEVNNRTAAAVMQRDTGVASALPPTTTTASGTRTTCRATSTASATATTPPGPTIFGVRLRAPAPGRHRRFRLRFVLRDAAAVHRRPAHHREVQERLPAVHDQLRLVDAAGRGRRRPLRKDRSRLLGAGAHRQRHLQDAANELYVTYQPGQGFTELQGDYDYFLPNLDLTWHLSEDIVTRASYSETIGRPGWQQIRGGQRLTNIVRVDGGDGSSGNPGLEPLLSRNFDLSLEWYYGESSYASIGYFRKNIKNFISDTIVREEPFALHTPVGGAYWNAALANGCAAGDMVCIRNYIFTNYANSPGVTVTGTDSSGALTGSIVGQPGDPIAGFDITTPANQRSDHLDGFEINLQHVFGDSGFGVAANYTKVDSGLTFDNSDLGTQYPMVGLSDSANLVGFYDKNAWQVRVAYNWRDEFLNGIGGGGTPPNPNWTEAYGQVDAIISYEVMENLTLSLEGINLTDETQRIHARHENMVRFATQTGPRYMFGVRYRF